MDATKNLVGRAYRHFIHDSLFRNSVWLMLSTGVMALSGFLFWTIATKHYSASVIGLASTFISAITLISSICLLGLNITLINHLPRARKSGALINSGAIIVSAATLIITILFLTSASYYSTKFSFLKNDWLFFIGFIAFSILSTADTLLEGALIAFKESSSVLLKNATYSLLKLGLAFAITGAGLMGLFSAYYLGLIACFIVSYYVLRKRHAYKLRERISKTSVKTVMKTSLGNYIESISTVLPLAILPLFITARLGPSQTAYFYLAMMIANALYAVPKAVARNVIAEISSQDEIGSDHSAHYYHAIKVLGVILVPAISLLVVFGKLILRVFGPSYSLNGYALLILLTLSVIPLSANSLFWAKMNISQDSSLLSQVNIVGCAEVLAISYYLLPKGITYLGFAWLIGQLVQTGVYLGALSRQSRHKPSPN